MEGNDEQDNALFTFTIGCSLTNKNTRMSHNNSPTLPTTTPAAHGASADSDEDFYGGYNELLSLDVDWDLLAPSPLMRMDGFIGRAQQPPVPRGHTVKAEPALESGMMGYGLI